MVTGVGGGSYGEQILKALQMSNKNYRIITADMLPFSRGLYISDKSYILPPASNERYIHELLNICKFEKVKALFHGSDPELKCFDKHRNEIEAHGIFLPINSSNVLDICLDKFKTSNWLKQNGFYSPETQKIKKMEDLNGINSFPQVLKPSIGGGGSVNTFLVQNMDECEMYSSFLLKIYDEFIAQRYVGNFDSEYTVGVLCDLEGVLINSIGVKKYILSGLSNKIKVKNFKTGEFLAISSGISQGQIGRFPEVTNACIKIATALGATGAINIQCRMEKNKCYVFEINPRFSGTTSLRAMVGYNEPDILLKKYIYNENIEPFFEFKEGYIMRGLCENFVETLGAKSDNANIDDD